MGICASTAIPENKVIFRHDAFLTTEEEQKIAQWNEKLILPYKHQMWITFRVSRIDNCFYVYFKDDETQTVYYLPTVHVYQELKRIYNHNRIIFTPFADKTKIIGVTITFL
jgi:hypothetical protein